METLYGLEISVNIFLQSLGAFLQTAMGLLTHLGDFPLYIALIPAIYWCADALVGLQVGMLVLFSTSLNSFFKMLFKGPRPYWISDRVLALSHESSFGIPSGHAMTSFSFWGQWSLERKQKGFTVLSAFIILLIGLSRLVLGVHFLSDVLAGWLLAFLLLWLSRKLAHPLSAWYNQLSLTGQIFVAFVSAAVLTSISIGIRALSAGWVMPVAWVSRAGRVDLFSLEGPLLAGGVWFGMLAGFSALRHYRGVFASAEGTLARKSLRYLLGLIVALLIYGISALTLPPASGLVGFLTHFASNALLGLWISALAPLAFERLGIGVIRQASTKAF